MRGLTDLVDVRSDEQGLEEGRGVREVVLLQGGCVCDEPVSGAPSQRCLTGPLQEE